MQDPLAVFSGWGCRGWRPPQAGKRRIADERTVAGGRRVRIGAQGIDREVGPEGDRRGVVFLVCGVEPLEGMVLPA